MQKCRYCGTDLLENTRFCGKCGSVQDAFATDAATTSNTPPPPQSWAPESGTIPASWAPESGTIPASWPPSSSDPTSGTVPAWSSNAQAPRTPSPVAENEDEQRKGIPPWSPLYGAALAADALLSSGQAYTPNAPVVQGTPQIGSTPSVAGSPTPYTNAPVSHPIQVPPHAAPVSHPIQGLSNIAPVSHPVQTPTNTVPVSHPVQTPPNTVPVNHPVREPQPIHHPPEQPGTQEHHRPHEPHRHHTHPEQHKSHMAMHVTKVAGGSAAKTIILVVTAVVVVAGGIGAAAHFLARPQSSIARPQSSISITSNYKVGNAPAGASGTILHISGQNFPNNSPVTFLLDGHAVPGNSGTQSDANGTFSANVTITDAWSVGAHTLTASDASNNSPKNSVSVMVVQSGQANTPGPNGAPSDDATFSIKATIQASDPYVGEPFASNPVLIITGHPDPEGGTICSPNDSGQPFTQNNTTYNHGTPFTEVETATCSGTYKAGQISYIETDITAEGSFQSNGVNTNCVLNNSAVILQLTGAYASNNTFSGTINYPYVQFTCDQQGSTFWQEALQGTWTGTIVTQ